MSAHKFIWLAISAILPVYINVYVHLVLATCMVHLHPIGRKSDLIAYR